MTCHNHTEVNTVTFIKTALSHGLRCTVHRLCFSRIELLIKISYCKKTVGYDCLVKVDAGRIKMFQLLSVPLFSLSDQD